MLSSHPDVYARNLLPLNRGYPLWTPEPSDQLSTCRRGGIGIGDVGVVVPENGSFDVFFNICLPRDHPLHKANGVPENFSPIKLGHKDVELSNAERPGCILSSPSVKREKATKTPPDDEGPPRSTNEFRLYSGEGAVLILPEGADFYDLRDKTYFREMAIQHGAEWYKFAMDHLHRLIRHDSLYLITGYNSTRSCSLASFQDAEGYTARFTVQNVGGRDDYSWQSKCGMEWRNGQADDKSETPNRAVFIQGFKIDLKSGFLGTGVSVTMDPPGAKEERHDNVRDCYGSSPSQTPFELQRFVPFDLI